MACVDYLSHCGFGSDFMSCPFYKTMKIENGCRKVSFLFACIGS